MARVTVDPAVLERQAQQILGSGREFNTQITNAYNAVGNDLRSSWYGLRYDNLVQSFNQMIQGFNSMLDLIRTTIPNNIQIAANNYYKFNGQPVKSMPGEAKTAITITTTPTVSQGTRFITTEVTGIQTRVQQNFSQAVQILGTIQQHFNTMLGSWTGEAADSNRSEFNTLKSRLEGDINKVNTDFRALMDQTIQDIAAAEAANM